MTSWYSVDVGVVAIELGAETGTCYSGSDTWTVKAEAILNDMRAPEIAEAEAKAIIDGMKALEIEFDERGTAK